MIFIVASFPSNFGSTYFDPAGTAFDAALDDTDVLSPLSQPNVASTGPVAAIPRSHSRRVNAMISPTPEPMSRCLCTQSTEAAPFRQGTSPLRLPIMPMAYSLHL
jgi:hypothetical protein